MRVIEPSKFKRGATVGRKRHLKRRIGAGLLVMLVLAAAGLGVMRYRRPLPALQVATLQLALAGSPVPITWPTYGQAAVGAVAYGVLASNGKQTPQPTASVAKVVTALAVLQKKPLQQGQQGEMITITDADVAIYNKYVAIDGSVARVEVGEQLSEYQALQALLLPSANNIAETLTNWVFGSQDAYLVYANQLTAKLNMTQTHIADSSGFSAQTVSTATDLVRLGIAAFSQPVIAEIVGQPSATIPVAGVIRNVNQLLGTNGINGIKTGNTEEAGGCYLASVTKDYNPGQRVTVISAVMAAPNLGKAMRDSLDVLNTTQAGFKSTVTIKAGQRLGTVTSAWGKQAAVVAKADVTSFGWQVNAPEVTLLLNKISGPFVAKNTPLGSVDVTQGTTTVSVDAITSDELPPPALSWKLKRIL